jgi:glycolate oxidase iron-sulfur subunit
VLAVINPGCYRQIQQGIKKRKLRTKVLHLAELLADADRTGSPSST